MKNSYGTLLLAPLAGYSDKAFREICTFLGADGAVTEMVSAEGLARNGEKTKALIERYEGEKNLIVQLFASNSDSVSRSLDELMKYNPTAIDFNAGCPVEKVVKTGSGSALMKTPEKIKEIMKVLSTTKLPLSVKFRLGWDKNSINYLEFAEEALEGGATTLTLHARTRSQGYSGVADWEAFKTLSSHFSSSDITLYASGDIFHPEDAVTILNEYNMDGIMFARGAIGNPFIFRETKDLIRSGTYSLPEKEERVEVALHHYKLMEKYYGENTAGREMRKHIFGYIKGLPGSSKVKAKINSALSYEEYKEALSLLD